MKIWCASAPVILVACGLLPGSAGAQTAEQAAPAISAVNNARVGCFSPQRAFSESTEGKASLARLTALQAEKTRQIQEKNKALQEQEQTLQAGLLSEEAQIRKTREVEKFRIDVQRFIADAQAEVTGLRRELENAFLFKLRPVVEKVAKDRGLQMIFDLDGDSVAWVEPSLDITGDVIKQLAQANAKH